MDKKFSFSLLFFLILGVSAVTQPVKPDVKGDLIIFHAGSLSVPMKEVAGAFNKEYPKVKLLMESAGSVASARKITDLDRPCDIMASADYAVIDNMLIPKYADWNIRFVANEMAVVYHQNSRFAKEITGKTWYDILMKPEVAFGRADPNADPCGYRTVFTIQLSEKFYKKPGLANRLMSKDLNYMRPKEVDLIPLIESGSIDYIFIYRSVAIQHKLNYLVLPDQVNLKNPALASLYATASAEINGKEPGRKEIINGEPMIYGITILRDAPNREAAIKFVEFLLSKEKGMAIMEKNGQPSVLPMTVKNYDKLPEALKKYALKD